MIALPIFLSTPDFVNGTPVFLATVLFSTSTPIALLGENDVPGKPNIFIILVFLIQSKDMNAWRSQCSLSSFASIGVCIHTDW